MDTTVKQRILGVIVLVGLLGFCLTVLLRNTKTQPHIQKINTHPPFAQTVPTVEAPNSVFTKPTATPTPTTPTNTATKITSNTDLTSNIDTETQNKVATQNITKTQKVASIQTAAAPSPQIVSTSTTSSITPVATKPVAQTAQPTETQDMASTQQQPEVNLTGASATSSATSATLATPADLSTSTPTATPTATPATTSAEKPHHKQQHHHAVIAAHKETSKSNTTAGDKKNFMVQLGTFSLPANATTLVEKLHSKGFAAVSEKMKTSKGEMTRVIAGKKGLDHTEAETLRKSLEKSVGINGIIISHSKD